MLRTYFSAFSTDAPRKVAVCKRTFEEYELLVYHMASFFEDYKIHNSPLEVSSAELGTFITHTRRIKAHLTWNRTSKRRDTVQVSFIDFHTGE